MGSREGGCDNGKWEGNWNTREEEEPETKRNNLIPDPLQTRELKSNELIRVVST